ncbi:MAG: PDZ domain-containing protein [Pseudomonadota bacterium]
MNTRKLVTLALALALPFGSAIAQDEAELERIRGELEEARQEVAEAAQEMARLQRELFEASGQQQSESFVWHSDDDTEAVVDFNFQFSTDEEHGLHGVFAGFPPRLGVLLGDNGDGESNRIIGVTPGSGAAEAGIQNNDRLLQINGQDVSENTSAEVRVILGEFEPGDTVDVLIARGEGSEIVLPVTLGSALGNVQILAGNLAEQLENIEFLTEEGERSIVRIIESTDGMAMPVPPTPPLPPLTGLLTGLGTDTDLISNHEGLAGYFGTGEGVLVLRIDGDNSMNLMSGDVILGIEGEAIARPVDVGRALLDMEPGADITIEVVRDGLETLVYGTVPASTFRPHGRSMGQRIRLQRSPRAPAAPAPPGSTL